MRRAALQPDAKMQNVQQQVNQSEIMKHETRIVGKVMVGFISTNITFEEAQNIHFTFCLNQRLLCNLAYQVSAREVCVCCSVKLTHSDFLKRSKNNSEIFVPSSLFKRTHTVLEMKSVCVFLIYASLSDLNIGDERECEINPDQ